MNNVFNGIFKEVGGVLYWLKSPNGRVPAGTKAGTLSPAGYIRIKVKGKKIFAHKIVWYLHHGYIPDMLDHINGNGADNRIENLRVCTSSQNRHNTGKAPNNTSGVKGVSWSKKRDSWVVQVQTNGVKKSYGFYKDLELAELVAIEAREKYHGLFARHV